METLSDLWRSQRCRNRTVDVESRGWICGSCIYIIIIATTQSPPPTKRAAAYIIQGTRENLDRVLVKWFKSVQQLAVNKANAVKYLQ